MQLVAGPELDAKVAEAIGLSGGDVLHGNFYVFRPELLRDFFRDTIGCAASKFECGDDQYEWSPSTDLNAAFDAAEKVLRKEFCDDWWQFFDVGLASGPSGVEWRATFTGNPMHFAPTPALAICAAVLALKEFK